MYTCVRVCMCVYTHWSSLRAHLDCAGSGASDNGADPGQSKLCGVPDRDLQCARYSRRHATLLEERGPQTQSGRLYHRVVLATILLPNTVTVDDDSETFELNAIGLENSAV